MRDERWGARRRKIPADSRSRGVVGQFDPPPWAIYRDSHSACLNCILDEWSGASRTTASPSAPFCRSQTHILAPDFLVGGVSCGHSGGWVTLSGESNSTFGPLLRFFSAYSNSFLSRRWVEGSSSSTNGGGFLGKTSGTRRLYRFTGRLLLAATPKQLQGQSMAPLSSVTSLGSQCMAGCT